MSILIPLSMLACNNDASDTSTTESIIDDGSTWAKSYVSNLADDVQSNPELSELNRLEDAVLAAQDQIIRPWITSWYSKDASSFQSLLQNDQSGLQWGNATFDEISTKDGIIVSEVGVPVGSDQTQQYLASFSKIENIQIDVRRIELTQNDAGTLELRYDLRGESDSFRVNDRGDMTLKIVKADGQWKI
ncbi:MAG: hypothetical protein VX278_04185, partial [Myxococcota bacterium]|nr:hypothetical protein [Myxococcota bacterium]